MIKSVYTTDSDILHAINKLYLHSKGFDLDATYSRGSFYKNFPEPKIKSDINPKADNIWKIDTTDSTLKNVLAKTKIKRMIFDPPFLVRTGTSENKSHMCKLYSFFNSKTELLEMYNSSLVNFCGLLEPKGVLVFKCQDYSDGRINHFIHNEVLQMAQANGFKAIDLFIKYNDGHVIFDANKKQNMARKVHSYFWVFRKL